MKKIKLDKFFSPKSVAIVGASRKKDKVGRVIFDNLAKSYQGEIYPVNPKAEEIGGIKCYSSLKDLPRAADLAAIALPAKFSLPILKQGVKRGIKNYVLHSAGFSETGKKGKELANKVKNFANQHNLNILGPNTLGLLNTKINLNSTFTNINAQSGGLSFISQSGAFISILLDWANEKNIGIDTAVSLGNKMLLDETAVLKYLANRQETKVIAVYLENFKRGKEFLKLANKVKCNKPLVLLKGGRTEKGKQSAQSHTGMVTGSYKIAKQILNQTGVITTEETQKFYNYLYSFSKFSLKNNNFAIITNAGGAGVIAADSLKGKSGKLKPLNKETQIKLREILPGYTSLKNPIDIGGDAEPHLYAEVLKAVNQDPGQNAILLIITPQAMTNVNKTVDLISNQSKELNKPVFVCLMGGDKVNESKPKLKNTKFHLIDYPHEGLDNFCKVYDYHTNKDIEYNYDLKNNLKISNKKKKKITQIIHAAQQNKPLAADKVAYIANTYGINLPKQQMISTKKELADALNSVPSPWVIKTNSVHKTDKKEVYVNLQTKKEAEKVFKSLANKTPLIVQNMVEQDTELLLGSKQDPDLGTVVIFGLGGIYTEILKETVALPAPASKKLIKNTLKQTKFCPVLKEFRGEQKPFEKVVDTIYSFSCLAADYPEVKNFEINPIILKSSNLYAVDFRILP